MNKQNSEKSKSNSINCLNNEQQPKTKQQKHKQQQQQQQHNEQKFGKSDENLKISMNDHDNENENFKSSTLSLSKSIKDLRFYVSNSYSPSLIIKPPLSPVIVNGNSSQSQIENDKININYQYHPKQQSQQLVVPPPVPNKRSSSADHSRKSSFDKYQAPLVKQETQVVNDSYRKYPLLNAKNMPIIANNKNVYKIEIENGGNNDSMKNNKFNSQQQKDYVLDDKDEILIDCILDMKAPSSPPLRPPQKPAPPIPTSRTMPNIRQHQQQNLQYSSTFKPHQVYIENNENVINYGYKLVFLVT